MKEHTTRNVSGSNALVLTKPFEVAGIGVNEKVNVTVDDKNRVIIEKVKK